MTRGKRLCRCRATGRPDFRQRSHSVMHGGTIDNDAPASGRANEQPDFTATNSPNDETPHANRTAGRCRGGGWRLVVFSDCRPFRPAAGGRRHSAQLLRILPVLVIFCVPLTAAAGFVARFKIVCPACQADVTAKVVELTSTRCCPQCGRHVVEGRPRSMAAYNRYRERRQRSFLRYWLWFWPVLGALSFGIIAVGGRFIRELPSISLVALFDRICRLGVGMDSHV